MDTSTPGCSVKDSFSALDLRRAGFRVLFDATWMARTGAVADDALPNRWSRVTDAQVLERWRRASGCDLDDSLLDRDEIVILAGRASGPDHDDVADIVAETSVARLTERGATRADDRISEAGMEDRKRQGYF